LNIEDWVIKAQMGDKEALLKLIMDRKTEYYKLAYVYTENREDAMDAMEDMIVILYQQVGKLKKVESFYSWSKTILVNCCKDILRKRKNMEGIDINEYQFIDNGNKDKEAIIDVLTYMNTLNINQQEAIKLKYLMDMDYESIAALSNVPVGTVKSRIFNGLKKLKEAFGGDY
jgi:RNA polymerase sigma-70 factor (ECF subfamily)